MDRWTPTPKDERITAVRLVGDAWEPCEYKDLRKGDIFRCVSPDGDLIDPFTLEIDEEVVGIAIADAEKLDPLGSKGQTHGWGCYMQPYENIAELKRKGLS